MRDEQNSTKALLLATIFTALCPLLTSPASASTESKPAATPMRAPTVHFNAATADHGPTVVVVYENTLARKPVAARPATWSGMQCVPYARNVSGIQVTGNAWQWWNNAAGTYARGHVPEKGSVLAFRSNYRMRLGHVAVVSKVINSREILVDHANWTSGMVMRGVAVVDVSEANNWSAVRVILGRSSDFGSVYPTYGFIYNRPDTGVMETQNQPPAPTPVLNPVPSDLRPNAERPWHTYEEVADAPAPRKARKGHLNLTVAPTQPIAAPAGGQLVGQIYPAGTTDRK
jgi:surface antigen